MKNKLLFILSFGFMSLQGNSQTIKENIDRQHKNPKRIENAARADVFIQKNKIASDSTVAKDNMPLSTTKKKRKKANKKS